jgi:hypothetical protein
VIRVGSSHGKTFGQRGFRDAAGCTATEADIS